MKRKILTSIIVAMVIIPMVTFAISSTNYSIEPLNSGNSGGASGDSSNFSLEEQQIGDVTVDISTSTNYNLSHGHLYPEEEGQVRGDFTVIPEKRVPATGNNGTRIKIEVYSQGGNTPIQTYSYYNTNGNGGHSGLQLTGLNPGTYDIAIKGYAHLKKRINGINLIGGSNTLDFSNGGSEELLCGDVYTNATYADGDNTVNSVDVTYLVSKWADEDNGVSDERADVDENGQVNSLDMTKTVNNYAVMGE